MLVIAGEITCKCAIFYEVSPLRNRLNETFRRRTANNVILMWFATKYSLIQTGTCHFISVIWDVLTSLRKHYREAHSGAFVQMSDLPTRIPDFRRYSLLKAIKSSVNVPKRTLLQSKIRIGENFDKERTNFSVLSIWWNYFPTLFVGQPCRKYCNAMSHTSEQCYTVQPSIVVLTACCVWVSVWKCVPATYASAIAGL